MNDVAWPLLLGLFVGYLVAVVVNWWQGYRTRSPIDLVNDALARRRDRRHP